LLLPSLIVSRSCGPILHFCRPDFCHPDPLPSVPSPTDVLDLDPARPSDPARDEAIPSRIEKVGYGLGDCASNLFWKTFEFFLVYFYTDVYGLSAAATGRLMLVGRAMDAISDPLVGYLADRTRTSWGRFRPYLIWMSAPLGITAVLAFTTPDLSGSGKLIYAWVTYTAVMVAYTAINVPYGALLGVISPDSNERTSASTYRFVAAFVGGLIVQYLTLDLVAYFGGVTSTVVDGSVVERVVNPQLGFTLTIATYSVIAVVLFVATFWLTKERVQPEVTLASTYRSDVRFVLTDARLHQILIVAVAAMIALASATSRYFLLYAIATYAVGSAASMLCRTLARRGLPSTSSPSTLQSDFNDLTSNRPWVVLSLFGLLQLTGLFIRGGAVIFYFKYFSGNANLASTFWVIGSFAGIAGMLATGWLTRRFAKRNVMLVANALVALLIAAFYFLRPDQTNAMLVLQVLAGLIGGPVPILVWSMYADIADYSEFQHHRRATGLIFSAATLSQKFGCAIGASMTAFALELIAYVAPADGIQQVQSAETLWGLQMMMSFIPAAFLLAASACLLVYEIDPAMEATIETELARRKGTPLNSDFDTLASPEHPAD
jgi:glycoside/pentoside/hexuronide:cation symporter, GPH family